MIGQLISGGIGAAASIFGQHRAGRVRSRAYKKMFKALDERKDNNEAWYNRRYNEDSTQRADAQQLLNRTSEMLLNRNRAIDASSIVTGGSDTASANAKAASLAALGNTIGNLDMVGQQRKDAIEKTFRNTQSSLDDNIQNLTKEKMQADVNGIISATKDVGNYFNKSFDMFNKLDENK